MDRGERRETGFFGQITKGTGIAVIIVLLAVLALSAIIRFTSVGDGIIKPVNQFIKITAIFIGAFFSLKGSGGYIKGFLVGILTLIITFLIFSMLSGEFDLSFWYLLDLALGAAVGVLSGIIAVNVKKNS